MNPRTVSDDFHEEIGDEELREEVDEEALEKGTKGDQETIFVEIKLSNILEYLSTNYIFRSSLSPSLCADTATAIMKAKLGIEIEKILNVSVK